MPSKAWVALTENLKDIEALLALHAEKGGNAAGRRYGLEVLNKSAIVLITAYWEAYCEDIAQEGLQFIVQHAKTADSLPKGIKKAIAKDLKNDANEIAVWGISDDKWRGFLTKRLTILQEVRNRKLNTPKQANIDELFESAIGLSNVSSTWRWARKLPARKAAEKLDRYIELRGAIAHRGKATASVKKAQVVDYLEFIKRAASKTGGAVKTHVRGITGRKMP